MKNPKILNVLTKKRYKWLVTGCAGFIGSNLTLALLDLNQEVVGIDNFSTGKKNNIEDIFLKSAQSEGTFIFIEGDVTSESDVKKSLLGVELVLHQAALGSVPRSIEHPLKSHDSNVTGHLNVMNFSKEFGIKRFVYASSSSVYGDHPALPKVEENIGHQLSPYAVTKYANELYAEVFSRTYAMQTLGLRYFNVFGPRQDPDSVYAAVIPKWIKNMVSGKSIEIFGDGETSRDFCFISNVIQANLLAALVDLPPNFSKVFNVAYGHRTSLNQLKNILETNLKALIPKLDYPIAKYSKERTGDVRHSLASIDKAKAILGYDPSHNLEQGIQEALPWYIQKLTS